ncbi:hypothetical protein ACJX0J_017786 [Zea mays]
MDKPMKNMYLGYLILFVNKIEVDSLCQHAEEQNTWDYVVRRYTTSYGHGNIFMLKPDLRMAIWSISGMKSIQHFNCAQSGLHVYLLIANNLGFRIIVSEVAYITNNSIAKKKSNIDSSTLLFLNYRTFYFF